MSKKLLALIITLVLIVGAVCSFSACNKTDVTPPTKVGYTVIGKVVAEGAPMVGVSVLVDGGGTLVTDENGMFIANGLDKDDVITFKKDGYVFYPASITVKEDATLRVEGFVDTSNDDDDDVNTPSDDVTPDDTTPDDVTPDDSTDDDVQDDTTVEDKLYNVANTSLLFENDVINLVFCVDKGFTSLTIVVQADGLSTPIEVNEKDFEGEFNKGNDTFVQYKIDVTALIASPCSIQVSALNKNGEIGQTGQVDFTSVEQCASTIIAIKNNTLYLTNYDVWARNYLVLNGVVVDEIYGGSVDLSSYLAYESGAATVAVLAIKSGAQPVYSNQLTVVLEGVDCDPQ